MPTPLPIRSARTKTAAAHGRVGLTLGGLIVWAVTLP